MVAPREIIDLVRSSRVHGRPGGQPYTANVLERENEFCLFFKPEVFSADCKSELVIDIVLSRLATEGIKVCSYVALPSNYLRDYQVMNSHYGVIDAISREAIANLSSEASEKLATLIGNEDYEILGGHQFLKKYEFFNSKSLGVFYDNGKNNKLAGGTHCILVNIRGRKTVLFNGFHPEQLDHYIDAGQAIVCLVCRTSREWKFLRSEMTGATNPSKGPASSLRHLLFERRFDIGIPDVSAGRNVIHVSAGPIEGAVEIARFFSDQSKASPITFEETSLGKLFRANSFDPSTIRALAMNDVIEFDGKKGPAFDVTEEIDTWMLLSDLKATR